MSLTIGIWPDADKSPVWTEVVRLLDPAAKLGGCEVDLSDHAVCWTVHDGDELIGAATTQYCLNGDMHVLLVGGRNAKAWIKPLDEMIGEWARDHNGCSRLTATGRRGWKRVLGWNVVGERDGMTAYERRLG